MLRQRPVDLISGLMLHPVANACEVVQTAANAQFQSRIQRYKLSIAVMAPGCDHA